jgi:Arc/MetJ family transcription regulator
MTVDTPSRRSVTVARPRAIDVMADPPSGNAVSAGYPGSVSKTSVEVDQDIVRQAAAILGTRTLRETIDAALREVVQARRRLELIALLSEEGRFDFDAAEAAWGADG